MTNDPITFRLSLGHEFFCNVRSAVRSGKEQEIIQALEALRGLEIRFEQPDNGRLLVFETVTPAAKIVEAVRGVYAVYQVPPERPLPDITFKSFLP